MLDTGAGRRPAAGQLRLGRRRGHDRRPRRSAARRATSRFLGDGTFDTRPGFGVFLSVGAPTGDSFKWPSWLPIQINAIGIQWRDIQADPSDFVLTLSASVTGIKGDRRGSSSRARSRASRSTSASCSTASSRSSTSPRSASRSRATLFGGEIDAALIGGILKVDASGRHDRPARHDHAGRGPRSSSSASRAASRSPASAASRSASRSPSSARSASCSAPACRPASCSSRSTGLVDQRLHGRRRVLQDAAVDRRPDAAARPGLPAAADRPGRRVARDGQAAGRRPVPALIQAEPGA